MMSSVRRLEAQDLWIEIVEFAFPSKILILIHKAARKLSNNATGECSSTPCAGHQHGSQRVDFGSLVPNVSNFQPVSIADINEV